MTVFLVIGGIGILLILSSLVIGDHVHGIFDALGGGDWFTGASLAGFLGALGFGGAITLSLTNSVGVAIVAGLLCGLVLGGLAGWAFMRLRRTQDGGAPTSASLIDRTGVVVSAIPEQGFGQVRVMQGGQLATVNARAAEPIATGVQVQITDVLSPTSVTVRVLYR